MNGSETIVLLTFGLFVSLFLIYSIVEFLQKLILFPSALRKARADAERAEALAKRAKNSEVVVRANNDILFPEEVY